MGLHPRAPLGAESGPQLAAKGMDLTATRKGLLSIARRSLEVGLPLVEPSGEDTDSGHLDLSLVRP